MNSQQQSKFDIPLVRAAFAEPFRLAMQKNGLDADAWFRKCRLPLAKLEDPSSLLPLKPFWRLVNRVAIEEDIADFGMQVAQAKPWFEIATLRPQLAAQPDLRSLLAKFCQLASGQSSNVTFAVNSENGDCRFEYLINPLIINDIQMEIYRVTSMIELVQVVAGERWRPQRLSLLMPENGIVDQIGILSGLEIRFTEPYTAIHFPETLLAASPTKADTAANALPTSNDRQQGALMKTDPVAALQVILIADLAGLTPRGLQRVLKARGSSYRDLLNDARQNYAQQQLQDPDVRASEIASRLGYREAGHFTRAFKRWTGVTPSAFRTRTR